jgi:hypothetical protein
MAEDASASVIPLHQPRPNKARASAERAKAYRRRKKASAANAAASSSDHLIPLDFPWADAANAALPIMAPANEPATGRQLENSPPATVTLRAVRLSRGQVAPVLLSAAALALAAVGIFMNGWFARSLGSTDSAGWLFMAVGMAADLVALVMPSCAAGLWQVGQRATALVGWGVWLMTFAFAITAGIGFASVNITDVTLARGARMTPAVQTAQAALTDAMAARDRECKGGVGKFCREREAAVNERRQALDIAMRSVERTADPQTEAAIHIVTWASLGALRPSADDFAMLRLMLLALLPQIGGILLLVGRVQTGAATSPGAPGLSGWRFGASTHPCPPSPAAATATGAENVG